MLLQEHKLIFTEPQSYTKKHIITKNPESLLESMIDLEAYWNEMSYDLMVLEHESVLQENVALLEDGKNVWVKKAEEWFAVVYNRIKEFIKKVQDHTKAFNKKAGDLTDNFLPVNKIDPKILSTIQVVDRIEGDYNKIQTILQANLSDKSDNLDSTLKSFSNIKDPRETSSKDKHIELNKKIYEICYNFSMSGRDDIDKKLNEIEKLSQEAVKSATDELKVLLTKPIKFNLKELNKHRKRLRNLQVISTMLVRNMDYFTIHAFRVCVDVAKAHI